MKNKRIISVVPDLKDGNGHMLFYHRALGEALKILGFEHQVMYYSANMKVDIKGWKNCIKIGNLDQNINTYFKQKKLFKIISDSVNFIKSINSNLESNSKDIIFIERFNLPELYCLGLISIFKKYPLIILFRHDPNYLWGGIFYKLILKIVKKLNNKKILILTDSSALTKNLTEYFNFEIYTLPIPLKLPKFEEKFRGDVIRVWWPGSSREDKGPETVLKLINQLISTNINNIKLIVSNEISSIINNNIIYVEKYLTDDEYLKYLNSSDMIFLPYCKIKYNSSTSNIFVEGILLKKRVLVTKGTWMESELKKFELECLAVDWDECQILEKIVEIVQDVSISLKIEKMSKFYSEFHTIDGYSKAFGNALKRLDNNE